MSSPRSIHRTVSVNQIAGHNAVFGVTSGLPANRKFAPLRQKSVLEEPRWDAFGAHRENLQAPWQTYTFTCTVSHLRKITCLVCH